MFNGLQGVFWSGIYGAHFVAPEVVELWWGALGMAVTIGWQAMLYFRAQRTVNELAVYPGGLTYRLTVSTLFGRPVLLDVPLRQVGPNPVAVSNGKFWIFKVQQQSLHYLLDRQKGTIYDLGSLNAFLGYDVADTVEGGHPKLRTFQNVHREEFVKMQQEQPQKQQSTAADTTQQQPAAAAPPVRAPPSPAARGGRAQTARRQKPA